LLDKKGTSSNLIEIIEQSYPILPIRMVEGFDLTFSFGAFFFIVPTFVLVVLINNEILKEKDKNL
jgi:hypothetical protein